MKMFSECVGHCHMCRLSDGGCLGILEQIKAFGKFDPVEEK